MWPIFFLEFRIWILINYDWLVSVSRFSFSLSDWHLNRSLINRILLAVCSVPAQCLNRYNLFAYNFGAFPLSLSLFLWCNSKASHYYSPIKLQSTSSKISKWQWWNGTKIKQQEETLFLVSYSPENIHFIIFDWLISIQLETAYENGT